MITFSEAQILGWITPLLWPFVRALALLASLPVFSQRAVPMRVKIGLAAFIAMAMQPMLPEIAPVPLDSPMAMARVVQQVVIGLSMGFATRLVFAAVEMGGEMTGLQMGLNFAGFFDPVTASQGTVTARFFATVVAFLFVLINGHLVVISALAHSFAVFPVSDQVFTFIQTIAPHRWGQEIFSLGLWIALPMIGMLLFVNLVLGLISRVAPQISIFSVGFPVTLAVGLTGMMLTLPLLERPFNAALERMIGQFL